MDGPEELKKRIEEKAERLALKYKATTELAVKLIDYAKAVIDLCSTYEKYKEIYEEHVREAEIRKLVEFTRGVCHGG